MTTTITSSGITYNDGSSETTAKPGIGGLVTASGAAIDFSGIPSWVRKITLSFYNMSSNGGAYFLIQLGYGGSSLQTTGYQSAFGAINSGTGQAQATNGFVIAHGGAGYTRYGNMTFSHLGSNIWAGHGGFTYDAGSGTATSQGGVALAGTLDRIRVTTTNGTDTFDSGYVNILYE